MLATIGLLALLRSRNSCTLRGARSQWKLLLTVLVSMIVVYVALYWGDDLARPRRHVIGAR
jgi:hypothetical protein